MPEGHTIHRIARDHQRLIGDRPLRVTSPQGRFAADAARVDGARIERFEAYGKHLFMWWSTGEVGHVHLGLFGKFGVHRGDAPEPRGALRMRLATIDADEPVTIDLRGPTACTVGPPTDRDDIVARLGPDPLRPDADPAVAIDRIRHSRRAVGALLLDQAVIAGIGNVYRAELMFLHGMHPERPGRSCDRDELTALWATAQRQLRAGVRANRIVTVDRDELGLPQRGRLRRADSTYVYGRDHCHRCHAVVATIEVANRTCYYCPVDQPR